MSAAQQREEVVADGWKMPTPSPHDAVFKEAMFREFVGDDIALAHQVVRSFLANAPGRLATIRQGLDAGDARMVELGSHTLKGIMCFFAAAAVLDPARELETIAHSGNLQAAAGAFAALEREILRLTPALEKFLAGAPD